MQWWASLVAVAGTLLGVATTYFFQRRTTERTFAEARYERARKEFPDGVVAVSSESMTLRRAEYDRWKLQERRGDSVRTYEALEEVYRQRVVARNALYRVRLLADPARDDELVKQARRMVDLCGHVADAETSKDLKLRDEEARKSVEQVIELAAARLQASP